MNRSNITTLYKESEKSYQEFVDRLPDGIYRSTPQGRFLTVNSALVKMLGYASKEELLVVNIPEDLYFSAKDRIEAKKFFKGDKNANLIARLKKKDGSELWVEDHGQQIFDARGRIIYYEGILRDITQRRQIQNALRASEEKYRSLFEESKDAVFISTPEGRLIDINSAGVDLFGYTSKDEILSINIAQELYINPHDRGVFHKTLAKAGFVKNYELILKRKDGKKLIALESATVVRDEQGKTVAYQGIIHDLTERKQIEEQLFQAQKMEAVGTLVGGIAHEFNNLLTVILGNAEFGKQDSKPSDAVYRNFNRIKGAASQARDIIRQLLSFSRRQCLQTKLLNLNETIEKFLKMVQRILNENIKLKADLSPDLAPVLADPVQIQQVLMNLCVNAQQAMPQGGQIIIKTRNIKAEQIKGFARPNTKSNKLIQLTITDTGIGMDKKTQAKIFEPFFTTKGEGTGTGLGLSVVFGIVQQHNGHIEVFSKRNMGTTFHIYFPAMSVSKIVEHEKKKVPVIRGGRETILVVEDEEAVLNVAVRILTRFGYDVLKAQNGKQGYKIFKAEHERIDLVILDSVLPEYDGREVFKKMRSINPDLAVLLVSGYDVKAEFDDLVQPEKANIQVLKKPYSKEILGKAVRELLDL